MVYYNIQALSANNMGILLSRWTCWRHDTERMAVAYRGPMGRLVTECMMIGMIGIPKECGRCMHQYNVQCTFADTSVCFRDACHLPSHHIKESSNMLSLWGMTPPRLSLNINKHVGPEEAGRKRCGPLTAVVRQVILIWTK